MRNRNIGSWFAIIGGMSAFVAVAVLIVSILVGWFNNINYIVDSDFNNISGREIVAVIGVPVIPVGIVNGAIYIWEDEKQEANIRDEINRARVQAELEAIRK